MKIQKIFYVLVLSLLMLTLTGATGVLAQDDNNNTKSSQGCCAGAKPVSECTPEERAACQPKQCDTKSQKCEPKSCSMPDDTKKDDSGN